MSCKMPSFFVKSVGYFHNLVQPPIKSLHCPPTDTRKNTVTFSISFSLCAD